MRLIECIEKYMYMPTLHAHYYEVAKQQVCMSVSCMLHTSLKYRDHYTSNIIVAVHAHATTMCNTL